MWQRLEDNNLGGENFRKFVTSSATAVNILEQVKEGQHEMVTIQEETKEFLEKLLTALEKIKDPDFDKDYRCCITEAPCKNIRMKVCLIDE